MGYRWTLVTGSPYPEAARSAQMELLVPQTSVRIRTNIAGGYESMEIGYLVAVAPGVYRTAYLPEPLHRYRRQGAVWLRDGAETLFEGRQGPARRVAGQVMGVTCRGHQSAFSDRPLDLTDVQGVDASASMISGALIQALLSQYYPWVALGTSEQFGEPGVTHRMSEFDERTLGEILDTITREGGADGNQWDFQVWEGPTAWLLPRITPADCTYRFGWDDTVELNDDPDDMLSHVTVNYTRERVGGSTEDATITYPNLSDTSVFDAYGVYRHVVIDGGTMTDAAADAFVRAYWRSHSTPRWSGTITRDATRGLELAMGGEQARHRVRAGDWVEVTGGPDGPVTVVITDTEWESEGDTLRVGVGPGFTGQADVFAHYARSVDAIRAGRNPLTGARLTTSAQAAYANTAIADLLARLAAAEATLAALS